MKLIMANIRKQDGLSSPRKKEEKRRRAKGAAGGTTQRREPKSLVILYPSAHTLAPGLSASTHFPKVWCFLVFLYPARLSGPGI